MHTTPEKNNTLKTLKAIGLYKSYKNNSVVKGISFEVKPGEVVGLLGPNGAGKTTSFYMVVGLISPDQGSILLNNEDITKLPMYQRAQKGIAYLPQEASVFRKMTVEENILTVLETLSLSEQEKSSNLQRLLDDFNINSIAKQKAFTLSGGERRRVEIARALALTPSFLLLDEPFAGIDPIAIADIQQMIEKLKKKGIGILVTDHNVRETLAICNLGYLLNDGKILEEGSPDELANSKIAKDSYLGEKFQL